MNILFLDQFSELGGAQRCLLDLAPALLDRGWNVHLAAPGTGAICGRITALGARYRQIHSGPYQSDSKSLKDLLRFPLELPGLSHEIAALARECSADIVYVNGPRLLPAAAFAIRRRIPVIFHIHSYLGRRYASALTGIAIAASKATVIANCHYVLEPLRPYLSRREVVYNGVEGGVRKERSTFERRIGVIGRIAPEKGQLEFVRMAKLLPPDYRFTICGAPLFSDPAYYEEVRRSAEGLPVDFIGWRDDVADVLSNLDLLVVPYAPHEATTRVILEAYAAGVPVIAPNSGGIPEIVSDGETGFLVSDPRIFAAKIQEVMNQPGLLERVAENAHKAWNDRYTLAHYQARILNIVERARA